MTFILMNGYWRIKMQEQLEQEPDQTKEEVEQARKEIWLLEEAQGLLIDYCGFGLTFPGPFWPWNWFKSEVRAIGDISRRINATFSNYGEPITTIGQLRTALSTVPRDGYFSGGLTALLNLIWNKISKIAKTDNTSVTDTAVQQSEEYGDSYAITNALIAGTEQQKPRVAEILIEKIRNIFVVDDMDDRAPAQKAQEIVDEITEISKQPEGKAAIFLEILQAEGITQKLAEVPAVFSQLLLYVRHSGLTPEQRVNYFTTPDSKGYTPLLRSLIHMKSGENGDAAFMMLAKTISDLPSSDILTVLTETMNNGERPPKRVNAIQYAVQEGKTEAVKALLETMGKSILGQEQQEQILANTDTKEINAYREKQFGTSSANVSEPLAPVDEQETKDSGVGPTAP